MKKMICIAGFGDDGSMFAPLVDSSLSSCLEVIPLNLPGFGAPTLATQPTTLDALAEFVDERARDLGAHIILAHSVASIIASLAARRDGSPIRTIFSLEGNLTAEDAYFSGTAAKYSSPTAFRAAFLARLADMAEEQKIIARYKTVVEKTDPTALWELGKDAHRFSQEHIPGDVLAESADVTYLFNSDNVPATSRKWLEGQDIKRIQLDNASHWASLDAPDLLVKAITSSLCL